MEIWIAVKVGGVKTLPHIIKEPNSLILGLGLGHALGVG